MLFICSQFIEANIIFHYWCFVVHRFTNRKANVVNIKSDNFSMQLCNIEPCFTVYWETATRSVSKRSYARDDATACHGHHNI